MKLKKVLSSIIATIIMLTSIVGFSISANAEDNPYNYSGEPTRAIYYVTPTMKGNDVKWVQCALNLYGNYGLAIDGSFGPACREATKKFQASIGLEQDGSFGPATRAKMVEWLNSRNSATPPQAQPEPQQPQQTASISDNPYNYSSVPSRAIYYVLPTMKGNDVKWVQSALNAYGNYGLSIDGSFGPACRNATKQFQASMGMTQDGSFGPATRAKMVEWLNGKVNSNNSSNSNLSYSSSISTEQIKSVLDKYGYVTGSYWTYPSGGSPYSGYHSSNRPGRNYSYSYNGVECYGFANFIMHEITGTNVNPNNGNSNNWKYLNANEVSELKVGDIVRIGKNNTYGHTGLVYTVDGNGYCTFAECWGGVQNKINIGGKLSSSAYGSHSSLSSMKNSGVLLYVYRYVG